jgi:hypothetical protein
MTVFVTFLRNTYRRDDALAEPRLAKLKSFGPEPEIAGNWPGAI